MLSSTLKSWLRSALILSLAFISHLCSADYSELSSLYQDNKWHSLLHLKDGKPQIKDSTFILSLPDFSPQKELIRTIELYKENKERALCRFPARYLYLRHHLSIDPKTIFQAKGCGELKRYIDYVPFDDVSLVFASEVMSSASSMMGHTFLNASGKNINEDSVSHTISFFTEFSSLNPFTLFYDATVAGMDGFFIVRPYAVDIEQYNKKEGRNLWSYKLALNQHEKDLLKLHIWELKDLEIKYLFQSYNCATLTLYLLSIVKPELKQEESLFVSPVDVAKAVNNTSMVQQQGVVLAKEWELRMLALILPEKVIAKIQHALEGGGHWDFSGLDSQTRLVALRYASLLKEMMPNNNGISMFNEADKQNFEQLKIDLTTFKNPTKSSQDSAFGVGIVHDSKSDFVNFSFMPASHYLYGDNRQYFSESELKIGEITLQSDIEKSDLKIDSAILYSVKSLVPTNKLVPQLSGSLFLGLKSSFDNKLQAKNVFELSGAIGKTYSLHKDINLYMLFGLGIGMKKIDQGYSFIEPNLGIIMNTVGSSKIILDYKVSYGHINSGSTKYQTALTWSWYGLKNRIVSLGVQSYKSEKFTRNSAELKFDVLF